MEDIKTLLQQQTEEIKKENRALEGKFERHIDVLKESFDHSVQLIAESVSSIDQRLKTLTDIVVKNAKDIEEIKIHIFAMKSDIEIIKNGLKRKVDMEEFEALEKRLALLEARVARA